MARGKKFDAAEKHFQKIKLRYESLIKQLNDERCSLHDELMQCKRKINDLEAENIQMKDWIERLLQYTELSKKDIQEACQSDKDKAKLYHMFTSLISYM